LIAISDSVSTVGDYYDTKISQPTGNYYDINQPLEKRGINFREALV
jgi:hypothetical protein